MKSPWAAAIERIRALSSPTPYRVRRWGRAGIPASDIYAEAEHLKASGQTVSSYSVRRALGDRGSLNRIVTILEDWRAGKPAADVAAVHQAVLGAADRLVVRCEPVTEATVQQELGGTISADVLTFARFEWTARPNPILLARAKAIRGNPAALTGWTAARVPPTPAEKRVARIAARTGLNPAWITAHPTTAAMLAA